MASRACLVASGLAVMIGGCRHARAPVVAHREPVALPAAGSEPLPLKMDRAALRETLVRSQEKRVAGRLHSLRDIERVIREDAPLIDAASRQAAVQPALKLLAKDRGGAVEEARRNWVATQEADILLESGGDPEDVSSANAVGVAQWIYETGSRAGLIIDVKESKRLTALIDPLKRQAAWLEYLARPDADRSAPGATKLTQQQAAAQLPAVAAKLEALRAGRRKVDPRYDPGPALAAHARYLLGLYARFPSLDWVMQAFHGGEHGATEELQKYLAPAWPGSTAVAVRAGNSGKRLTYEDVYFGMAPRSHFAAFNYVYGRLDDHRYYWWKVVAARRAIALYRRDPAAFRRRWEALLPGRAKEATWYPQAEKLVFTDAKALLEGMHRGLLVDLPLEPDRSYLSRPMQPQRALIALRPEAAGALSLAIREYRRAGGKQPLVISALVESADAERPPKPPPPLLPPDSLYQHPPGGGPPIDFDFHATGLAADILRPADALERKKLEYALGWLGDREILWWRDVEGEGVRHYHLVPSPRYAAALKRVAGAGGRRGE